MSDQELEQIFEENFPKIYDFFYFKTLNKEIAEDLTSSTFLKLAEAIREDIDMEDCKAYLFGIARNSFNEYLSDKYDDQSIALEIDLETYIDKSASDRKGKTIEERAKPYIDLLPSAQRTVAELRFLKKMSLDEICEELDKNMNYVKKTQNRAMKSLSKLVETVSLQ